MKSVPRTYPNHEERQAVLVSTRRQKMARSAHAYVRGSTEKFYEWLASSEGRSLPDGPPVWICGDCHTGNLGPISNRNGFVRMGIRDLDQTVIGNPAHDLVRLGLSLTTGARSSNLPGIVTASMLEHMIDGYAEALEDSSTDDDDEDNRPGGVDRAMRIAMNRSWSHLAREREVDSKSKIPLGAAFWPLSDEERAAIEALSKTEELRALVTSLNVRDDDATVKLVDAAYWRKGCSSLGLLRYAMLVRVRNRTKRTEELGLLDIKEATQALAPRDESADMPRDNGQRVLMGARHLTPSLGKRMMATRLLGSAVFIRELRPQDLKLELESISREEAAIVARYLASVVGHAHARQMDAASRKLWQTEMSKGRSKTLDAPSWLWKNIIGLVMQHEASYLEHCRRHDWQSRECFRPLDAEQHRVGRTALRLYAVCVLRQLKIHPSPAGRTTADAAPAVESLSSRCCVGAYSHDLGMAHHLTMIEVSNRAPAMVPMRMLPVASKSGTEMVRNVPLGLYAIQALTLHTECPRPDPLAPTHKRDLQ